MANLSRTQQQTAMLGQLLKTAGGRKNSQLHSGLLSVVVVITCASLARR